MSPGEAAIETRTSNAPSARISVLIPTWQAGPRLEALIEALGDQTWPPFEVVVVDSSSPDGTAREAERCGCCVEVIPKAQFNHGATRNLCAGMARGEVLVFMTQDALPANRFFLEELVRPIVAGQVAGAYARQIAPSDASPLEQFARSYNYGPHSHERTIDDLPRMGFKAFFFSNVASAVDREAFCAVGGFPDWVIMDEDVLLCARLLRAGHRVAYRAEAVVWHGHRYTVGEHLRRYFDIGAFVSQAGTELEGAHTGGEGLRYVREQTRALIHQGAWGSIGRGWIEAVAKWAGFQLGRRHQALPCWFKQRLSMHAAFWLRDAAQELG